MTKKAGRKQEAPPRWKKGQSGNPKTKWKKGKSGNPKGRPLKISGEIKKYAEGENIRIAKADLARVIEILMSKPREKLNDWLVDPNTSVYVAAIITALGDSVANKNFHKFRQIVEMVHGKPEQVFTVKEDEEKIDPNMPDDKAAELYLAFIKRK